MATASKWIHDNLVFYDSANGHRWLDAIGPDVVKLLLEFVYLPVDDTTGDPLGFTNTIVEAGAGDTVTILSDQVGGELNITTAGNEDDGISMQVKGEAFKLDGAYPLYFGIRFRCNSATQVDLLAGLCITDTTLTAGMTDGVYFRKADGSTSMYFVEELNSAETAGAVLTFAANTWYILEFVFDGTYVDSYVNGTLQTRLAVTTLPNDEELTPSFEVLNGEAAVTITRIDWIRCIQIRA